MSELVELLPSVLLYLTSGFIFIQVFNFISSIKPPGDYKHIIIKSLIVGYVLTLGYHIVPSATENNLFIDISLFLIICIVLAYLLGRLYISPAFLKVCHWLRIRRTVNSFIWNDIEDKKHAVWVRAINYELGIDYVGQLALYEDFQRKPQIVLCRYIQRKLNGDLVADYSQGNRERVLIDTEKYDVIELTYHPDSENTHSSVRKKLFSRSATEASHASTDSEE